MWDATSWDFEELRQQWTARPTELPQFTVHWSSGLWEYPATQVKRAEHRATAMKELIQERRDHFAILHLPANEVEVHDYRDLHTFHVQKHGPTVLVFDADNGALKRFEVKFLAPRAPERLQHVGRIIGHIRADAGVELHWRPGSHQADTSAPSRPRRSGLRLDKCVATGQVCGVNVVLRGQTVFSVKDHTPPERSKELYRALFTEDGQLFGFEHRGCASSPDDDRFVCLYPSGALEMIEKTNGDRVIFDLDTCRLLYFSNKAKQEEFLVEE